MASLYTPVQRDQDTSRVCEEYESTGMSAIKQQLFTESETPYTDRSSTLLSSSKQPVLVYLRVRPKNAVEIANSDTTCLHISSDNGLLTVPPKSSHVFRTKGERTKKNFLFSHIFPPQTTQKAVFENAVLPALGDFLNGQNCLVFSYGVTNSGKSYTITGKSAEPGILPRALDVIFNSIGEHQVTSWEVKPQHYASARYLTDQEKSLEMRIRKTLLEKAMQLQQTQVTVQSNGNTTEISEEGEGCSNTEDTIHQLEESTTMSKTLSISNLSRITEEGGSLCLEDLQVHEDTILDVDKLDGTLFSIWVSFAEIYNEFIYDLLGEDPKPGQQRPALKLSEDRHHNPFIKGLREIKVESAEEALQLLRVGMQSRHVAATRLNYHSSRSHSIFTIKILRVTSSGRRPKVARINRLSIVDLAGSESTRRTGATGMRVKEAGNINNSLLTLGRCIEAMRHNQRSRKADERVVPFRESKLTQLLQTYFVGKGKGAREGRVAMFVNVSNTASVYDETLRVLNFSALASKVVPETKLLPPSLLSIPESSPFRSDSEEEQTPRHITSKCPQEQDSCTENKELEASSQEEHFETTEASSKVTFVQGACNRCKLLESEYEQFKERARTELAQAKTLAWEQEFLIRQQVCSEFNEQLVEIEEKHCRELQEQEESLEEMYQERLDLLHKSMKKQRTRKRVRTVDEEDKNSDEDKGNQVRDLMRENRELGKLVEELRQELELEKARAASEMTELSITHDTKMVRLREITNTLSLDVNSLKKDLAQSRQENESLKIQVNSLQSEIDSLDADKTNSKLELEQAMKEAESFRQERDMTVQEKEAQQKAFEKENEELLMQIIELETTVRSPLPSSISDCSQTDPAITGWGTSVSMVEMMVSAEAAEVELSTLKGLVASLKNEVSSHDNAQKLLKTQHSHEVERLQKELKQSRSQLCGQEVTIDYLKEQLEERSNEVRKHQQEVQQLTAELKSASEDVSDSDNLIQDLKTTVKQFEDTFETQTAHISKLKSENELLKESIEVLQEKAETDKEELASLRLRIERLTDTKSMQSAHIEELGDELAKSSRHLMQREAELTDHHESAREVLENQLADLKKRCAVLEQEAKETQLKLEDKEMAIVDLHKTSSSEQVAAAVKVGSLSEELQQIRASLRDVEEERDQLKEAVFVSEQQLNSQLESLQGNHQLEVAQLTIKVRTLTDQLTTNQQAAEAKLCELEKIRDERENELCKENQQLKDQLTKETAEMTGKLKQADAKLNKIEKLNAQQDIKFHKEKEKLQEKLEVMKAEIARVQEEADTRQNQMEKLREHKETELRQESQRLMGLLEVEKKKVADLIQQIHSSNTCTTSSGSESQPPEEVVTAEPLYDSVHDVSEHEQEKQEEETPVPIHESTAALPQCTSDVTLMNITRQLPVLERSSQLKDISFEDFESPRRIIEYNPLKDARRIKSKKRATKKKVMGTVNTDSKPQEQTRYALRNRKKALAYAADPLASDSESENKTPLLKKIFKGKKAVTTTKKKRLRKSQISAPLEISVTPEVTTRSRAQLASAVPPTKMQLGGLVIPPEKLY